MISVLSEIDSENEGGLKNCSNSDKHTSELIWLGRQSWVTFWVAFLPINFAARSGEVQANRPNTKPTIMVGRKIRLGISFLHFLITLV